MTGAAQGIGRACALRLARAGCHVVLVDLKREQAEAVAAEVEALGARALAVEADVRGAAAVERSVSQALAHFGRIDVLVNNAGGLAGHRLQPVAEADDRFWDDVIDLNLRAVFLWSRAVARALIARGSGGALVNIASISGLRGSPRLAPYGAAKAAVMQLTQTLALELAPHGIRVNCVAPASIETPQALAGASAALRDGMSRAAPLGRLGQADEVASVVLSLASRWSAYVTGQTVMVDGGLSCTTARIATSGR